MYIYIYIDTYVYMRGSGNLRVSPWAIAKHQVPLSLINWGNNNNKSVTPLYYPILYII